MRKFNFIRSLSNCSITTDAVQPFNMQTVTEDFVTTDNFTPSFENSTSSMFTRVDYVKPVDEYDIVATGRWIFRNSWKFVVPPGLFGNLMVILATLKMKPFNSTSLFMLSLASVDLSVNIFRIPFKLIVHLYSTTSCRVMWYLYNVFPVYSNYILFFWTLERVIAVQFPLRAGDWCTVKRTAIVVIATGIFSFAIMLPYPIAIVGNPPGVCRYYDDMVDFMLDVWRIIDSSVFVFIPMIVIFLSNVLIINRLYQSTKRHKKMTSSEDAKKRREKEQRNTTITLISVCVAFLLLHMPLAVYNLTNNTFFDTNDQERIANWAFVNMFGMSLMEVQNSVNFYLYFLTGRRYRQFTFSILFPCRKGSIEQNKIATKTASTDVSGSSMPQ